jgi:hypothetical protein
VSLEAAQERWIWLKLIGLAVNPVGTEGGVGVVAFAAMLLALSFPALSIADTA